MQSDSQIFGLAGLASAAFYSSSRADLAFKAGFCPFSPGWPAEKSLIRESEIAKGSKSPPPSFFFYLLPSRVLVFFFSSSSRRKKRWEENAGCFGICWKKKPNLFSHSINLVIKRDGFFSSLAFGVQKGTWIKRIFLLLCVFFGSLAHALAGRGWDERPPRSLSRPPSRSGSEIKILALLHTKWLLSSHFPLSWAARHKGQKGAGMIFSLERNSPKAKGRKNQGEDTLFCVWLRALTSYAGSSFRTVFSQNPRDFRKKEIIRFDLNLKHSPLSFSADFSFIFTCIWFFAGHMSSFLVGEIPVFLITLRKWKEKSLNRSGKRRKPGWLTGITHTGKAWKKLFPPSPLFFSFSPTSLCPRSSFHWPILWIDAFRGVRNHQKIRLSSFFLRWSSLLNLLRGQRAWKMTAIISSRQLSSERGRRKNNLCLSKFLAGKI